MGEARREASLHPCASLPCRSPSPAASPKSGNAIGRDRGRLHGRKTSMAHSKLRVLRALAFPSPARPRAGETGPTWRVPRIIPGDGDRLTAVAHSRRWAMRRGAWALAVLAVLLLQPLPSAAVLPPPTKLQVDVVDEGAIQRITGSTDAMYLVDLRVATPGGRIKAVDRALANTSGYFTLELTAGSDWSRATGSGSCSARPRHSPKPWSIRRYGSRVSPWRQAPSPES